MEPAGFYNDERRPDVWLTFGVRRILVDVTIRHPLSPSYVVGPALTPLGVAQRAEQAKRRKYEQGAIQAATNLHRSCWRQPEAGGPPLSPSLTTWRVTPQITQTPRRRRLLLQGISVAVQFGNTQLIMGAYQHALSAPRLPPQLHLQQPQRYLRPPGGGQAAGPLVDLSRST